MNVHVCLALYLMMQVDYTSYKVCDQNNFQTNLVDQVCICKVVSSFPVQRCVKRSICQVNETPTVTLNSHTHLIFSLLITQTIVYLYIRILSLIHI